MTHFERTLLTTRSIEYDAVVVADGAGALADPRVVVLLQEMYRHCKAIAAWVDGACLLAAAAVPADSPGVFVSPTATAGLRKDFIGALALHRAWDRFPLSAGPMPA